MITNVLGVRCTPPVKGLGAKYTTTDRCVTLLLFKVPGMLLLRLLLLLLLCAAATTVPSSSAHDVENMYVYSYIFLSILRTFANFSLCTSSFRQNTKYSDTGSPAGHIGLGLSAIRALWSAWRALKRFFPAGVDKTISLVSVREALFCTTTYIRTYGEIVVCY